MSMTQRASRAGHDGRWNTENDDPRGSHFRGTILVGSPLVDMRIQLRRQMVARDRMDLCHIFGHPFPIFEYLELDQI